MLICSFACVRDFCFSFLHFSHLVMVVTLLHSVPFLCSILCVLVHCVVVVAFVTITKSSLTLFISTLPLHCYGCCCCKKAPLSQLDSFLIFLFSFCASSVIVCCCCCVLVCSCLLLFLLM